MSGPSPASGIPLGVRAGSASFLSVIVALGAVAAWPIYRTPWFLVLVAVAWGASIAIAAWGVRRAWPPWRLVAATALAYVVLALPVAVPSALTSPDAAVRGLGAALAAPVTGWKAILTLDLPLGSYQATPAPALLLFLCVGVASLTLAWRARRLWTLAAPIALLLPVWGVVFGSSAMSPPVRVGEAVVTGPVETLVAVGAVLAALGHVVWRSNEARRRARTFAVVENDASAPARRSPGLAGRVGIAAGMLVVATLAGAITAPAVLAGQPREVLRTQVDPRLELLRDVSPLAQYRSWFTAEQYDRVLFAIDPAVPAERVRLAVLPFFDGRLARIVDPAAGEADLRTAFSRVPSTLRAAEDATVIEATVTIDALGRPWLPLAGALTSIAFDGTAATSLSDGFFYNRDAGAGVQMASSTSGMSYRFTAAVDPAAPALSALQPPEGHVRMSDAIVPASVVEWMQVQQVGTDGTALQVLIDRLRARGFLSHALLLDADAPPPWLADRGVAGFHPSRAGHSSDRIDQLFRALLDRQYEVGDAADADLVAAVGDDEQFAVAAAMIADQLGFPTRIVLGTRLAGDDDERIPSCTDGVCRGRNMTAWLEVQDASGAWVAIDVTPQSRIAPHTVHQQRNDPRNPTDVRGDNALTIPPVDSRPPEEGARDDRDDASGLDLSALWEAVRVVAIGLGAIALVLAPFVLVVAVKALRRRRRRRAGDPADRIAGGWDEYVDLAVDYGHAAPRTRTRQELAATFDAGDESARGALLATWADRSVFDAGPPSDEEGVRVWRAVEAERVRFARARGRWGRLRARVSLRSLRRRLR
ncbi:transglutaminase domain-containing protein [Microbacterium sp. No. 7]|uniref:transglutaminase domain-containing protein n=1 Tax=Microbacterium sp. No. 7 TaxID=1714373 RepID=UPI0006ECD62A|nr:transglutaminase domain-containing protein [Microbacterium sp. No. 7]ALJ19742.1 hypothetical protein AOA12_07420 [Microbacterium sp. No. 7]